MLNGLGVSATLDLTTDPHCTVVHLGKNAPATSLATAVESVERVSREFGAIHCLLDGVARFTSKAGDDPVVALLWGQKLSDAVSGVRQSLGYPHSTLHLTLGRVIGDAAVQLSRATVARSWLTLEHVAVTCGDARYQLPLSGPP
jgi:hypothetical protein